MTDPLLLLHGQPGNARDWSRVIAAIGPRAKTLAIDRPGWDGTSNACGLECNAAVAVSALERAGIERGVVAGYSMGGAVAAWLAAPSPERVSRLVLIAPAANVQSLVTLDYVLAAPIVGEIASGLAIALAATALRRAPSLRAWESFVTEQRMLIRELPRLEPLLGRIEVPTTVVIGTADHLVPPASARALVDQIPGAELIELAGANHLLPWRRAKALADILVSRSG